MKLASLPTFAFNMKTIITILFLSIGVAHASLLGLIHVKQPLYLPNSDGGPEILVMDVVVATSTASPCGDLAAIAVPFTPPTDGSWTRPTNVNLTSLCGIKVTANEGTSRMLEVVIDATSANIPVGVPFTLDQVIESVSKCVKLVATSKGFSSERLELKIRRPKPTSGESGPHE